MRRSQEDLDRQERRPDDEPRGQDASRPRRRRPGQPEVLRPQPKGQGVHGQWDHDERGEFDRGVDDLEKPGTGASGKVRFQDRALRGEERRYEDHEPGETHLIDLEVENSTRVQGGSARATILPIRETWAADGAGNVRPTATAKLGI